MTSLVIDASIFIAAFRGQEPGHKQARELLSRCVLDNCDLVEPTLLLPELFGALVRTGSPAQAARRILSNYRNSMQLSLEPVTISLAETAAGIAALGKIKGSDAVYLAVARSFAIPLITLDREQLERAPADVEVFTPEEALAKWWPD